MTKELLFGAYATSGLKQHEALQAMGMNAGTFRSIKRNEITPTEEELTRYYDRLKAYIDARKGVKQEALAA